MSYTIDVVCSRMIDEEYPMSDREIVEAIKLEDTIHDDKLLTYADCRYTLQSIVVRLLTIIDNPRDSWPCNTYEWLIGRNAAISNVCQPISRELVAYIVDMMMTQTFIGAYIAKLTLVMKYRC